MNRNQIAMLSLAALILALIAARRKRKAMMAKASDMPPSMSIKENAEDRPERNQMPSSIHSSVPDNIVENLRQPIPAARVPVEPLAQDYSTRNIVDPARTTVQSFGSRRRRNIILQDI